jgi:hypothetical protein
MRERIAAWRAFGTTRAFISAPKQILPCTFINLFGIAVTTVQFAAFRAALCAPLARTPIPFATTRLHLHEFIELLLVDRLGIAEPMIEAWTRINQSSEIFCRLLILLSLHHHCKTLLQFFKRDKPLAANVQFVELQTAEIGQTVSFALLKVSISHSDIQHHGRRACPKSQRKHLNAHQIRHFGVSVRHELGKRYWLACACAISL